MSLSRIGPYWTFADEFRRQVHAHGSHSLARINSKFRAHGNRLGITVRPANYDRDGRVIRPLRPPNVGR